MEIRVGRMTSIGLLITGLILISCGKSPSKLVNNLSSEVVFQDGGRWLVTDFQVNLGNLYLPDTVISLNHNYGMFRSYNQKEKNYFGLDLNIESILNTPSSSMPTLPNRNPIPLNSGNAEVIELPINGTKGKVYIAVSGNLAMIGIATVIKNFEGLRTDRRRSKFADVFKQYKVGNINVLAGVFTSVDNKRNGVAIFADMAPVWNPSFYFQFNQRLIFKKKITNNKTRRELRRKLKRIIRKRMLVQFR
jgi:hypothetical protein